jgi:hypothetical protein
MQKMHYLDDLFKEAKDVRGGLDKIVEYVQRELEAATQQKALFKVEECDEIKWIVRATLNRVRYRNDDETMCTMKDFEGVDDDEMSFVPKFAYVDGQQRKWAMNTMHELLALKETHKGSPAHRLAVGHFYTYTHVLLRASLSDTINILKTQAQLSASYPVEPYGRIMRGQLRLQIDYMCITFDCIIQLAREMLADFLKGEKAIEDIMDHNMRDTRLLELLKERFDGEAEYNVEEAIDEVQQGIDEKHAEDRRRRLEWLRSRRDTLKEQEFRNQWIKDHPEFTEKFKELSSICMRLNRIAYTKVDLSEQEKKEMRNADKEKQNLMKPREEWVQQQMNEWKQLPQPTDEELLGEMKEVHPIVCPF